MNKVTSKVNFHSLWTKIALSKDEWFKVTVNNKGITFTTTIQNKSVVNKLASIVDKQYKDYIVGKKQTYGDFVSSVETEFKNI